jgi:hypothetical protein
VAAVSVGTQGPRRARPRSQRWWRRTAFCWTHNAGLRSTVSKGPPPPVQLHQQLQRPLRPQLRAGVLALASAQRLEEAVGLGSRGRRVSTERVGRDKSLRIQAGRRADMVA